MLGGDVGTTTAGVPAASPTGASRLSGGGPLLALPRAFAFAARRPRCACEPEGPVTAALVDLCHTYVARRGQGVPVDVAVRHDGVAGPAWLLAVAVVRSDPRELVADTLELATMAGAPTSCLGDYVAYVELAAGLLAGESSVAAIETATGGWLPTAEREPRLCGETAVDALAAGLWALVHPGGVADVMTVLARRATPAVGAAVAGLLGLRDGSDAMPAQWQRRLRVAAACRALGPGLMRARCHDHLGRPAALAGAGAR